MTPFFSICIPSTNREQTIISTLNSLAEQIFRDFEVIISDCNSTDNTKNMIDVFLKSDAFKNNPFTYKLQYLDYTPKTVEDWNEPLKIAKGKYIAMLEGDDMFLPNHLEQSYQDLTENNNIGLYFPGEKYPKIVLESSSSYVNLYSLKSVPAPSETIFIRVNKNNTPFIYNVNEYNYCPEIELYLDICKSGYSTMHSGVAGVIRDITLKSRAKWKYYRDHFYFAEKFKYEVTKKEYISTVNSIKKRAVIALIYDYFKYKIPERVELKKELKDKFGRGAFYISLLKGYGYVCSTFIKNKLIKISKIK